MIRFLIQYGIAVALAYGLAISVARCTLPGALAQRPAARGTRLIRAQHALRNDAPAPAGGLVALTGAYFTDQTLSVLPFCPDTLGGVSVWIGGERQPLRLVSPGLVIVVPTRPTSWLVVTAQDGRVCYAPLRMASVSPAILYAGLEDQRDLDGQLPLALWRSGKLAPRVLDGEGVPASTEGAPTVLAIQGTGWRNAGNDIRVTLGGVACAVLASGPSAVFGGESAGQDQAAIEIPVALTQRGPLDLVIEAAGQRSNIARVCVRD